MQQVKREADEAIEEFKQLMKQKERAPKWHEVELKSHQIKELMVSKPLKEEVVANQEIKTGDYVSVRSVNQTGYVLEGPNLQGEVVVQIGSIRLSVHKDQLAPAQAKKEKRAVNRTPSFLEKAQQISPEIDLRGKYAEDALAELDKYLEDANLVGIERVRVIHGKGTGALRLAVREYLRGHRYVDDYRDGLREEGGYGVTVITLK